MNKKTIGLIGFMVSTLIIGTTAFVANGGFEKVFSSPEDEYAIIFDKEHNYNLELHNATNYKRTNALTQRGTEIEFFINSPNPDVSNNWRSFEYKGHLLNTTMIGSITDITATFSVYNEAREDDSYVDIKYGWVVGSTADKSFDQSPLTDYEDFLTSGETFYFSNVKPSYFFIEFSNVKVESIIIHFDCVEYTPSVEDKEHYELVTSMDDINSTDTYAIGSAKTGSGYMMSTATYNATYANDKIRQIYAATINDGKTAYNEHIMQFKITKESDLYYFQAQNYLGTYTDGYLNTPDNDKNELFVGPSESKTGFALTMEASYEVNAVPDLTTHPKKLMFYDAGGGSGTAFNCYTKTAGKGLIYLFKYVEVTEETLVLDYSKISSMSKSYSNGNYGRFTSAGTTYEYYRTVRAGTSSSGYAFSMINPNYYYGDNGYPSSFYNVVSSPIYGIKSISVTYKATNGLKIGYSKVVGEESYQTLPARSSYTEESITVDKMHFFKIMTNGSDAYIKDITLVYTGKTESISYNTAYSGNRKAVTAYSGTLVDGVATKTMYISNTLETRTYTYYSKQYAYDNYNTIDKSKAFMIDPVDVCNYYMAFHEFPANYVTSGEKSTYGSKFGSYARQVSTYSRTDGYATAVPYNNRPGQSTPIYYELDIDVNGSYSLSSRQVGRVVVWQYGFSCYSDGSIVAPVCVYTDDHYATFQEYDNMGGFASRFNSERSVVNKVYTPLNTL